METEQDWTTEKALREMTMNKGMLVVVSGPSGCGKDTVVAHYASNNDEIRLSISTTTRAIRLGEKNGVDYNFISEKEFNELIKSNGLLEYANYAGNWYGTPKISVDNWLEQGKTVVLIIEVQGGAKIKGLYPDAVSIFLLPPSMEVLEKRLRGRATDSDDSIQRRMIAAVEEINSAQHYDYIVINDEIGSAVEKISTIIQAEKLKTIRSNHIIEGVIKNA